MRLEKFAGTGIIFITTLFSYALFAEVSQEEEVVAEDVPVKASVLDEVAADLEEMVAEEAPCTFMYADGQCAEGETWGYIDGMLVRPAPAISLTDLLEGIEPVDYYFSGQMQHSSSADGTTEIDLNLLQLIPSDAVSTLVAAEQSGEVTVAEVSQDELNNKNDEDPSAEQQDDATENQVD